MKIHDTLYMLRKCMDGGDEDVFLFAGIILFIIFLKYFQKVFDECYREKDTVAEEIDKMNNSKRNYRIAVKLNEEENKQLEFISKELSISRAEVIRELITDSSYELYYGHKRGKKND